jgi:trehalose-6-phosphate synthase
MREKYGLQSVALSTNSWKSIVKELIAAEEILSMEDVRHYKRIIEVISTTVGIDVKEIRTELEAEIEAGIL